MLRKGSNDKTPFSMQTLYVISISRKNCAHYKNQPFTAVQLRLRSFYPVGVPCIMITAPYASVIPSQHSRRTRSVIWLQIHRQSFFLPSSDVLSLIILVLSEGAGQECRAQILRDTSWLSAAFVDGCMAQTAVLVWTTMSPGAGMIGVWRALVSTRFCRAPAS